MALPITARAADTPAERILRQSDNIRLPDGDFVVHARVLSRSAQGRVEEASYEVLTQGRDRTLIKTMAPATERGNSILMLDKDMWIFLPDVSKPVRVALQQRLMGEVANGDLARMKFTGDYQPTLAQRGQGFYKLNLKALHDDLTYSRIDLWVEERTYRPIRVAFYAASGKLLKVGSYEDYKTLAGQTRPGRLVLSSAIEKGRTSTIFYEGITEHAPFPEKYFTKDYLKKLKY